MNRQRMWISRVNKLIYFMNYDWDLDEKWKEYLKAQQGKKKKEMDEKEVEGLRRGYYASQVDKEFDKTFE